MPDISGLEVIKRLKADEGLKSIPVVAVTAFAMEGDEQKMREGGCDGYVSKPLSVVAFMHSIAPFLR